MAEKPKSKKELRQEIVQSLEIIDQEVLQRCPYTCMVVVARYGDDNHEYRGVGFSKVCWPDLFTPDKGEELAEIRALKDIANQVIRTEIYPPECVEIE